MDIYIVAKRVGELWEPTALVHRNRESADKEYSEIQLMFPAEEFYILTTSLHSATVIAYPIKDEL